MTTDAGSKHPHTRAAHREMNWFRIAVIVVAICAAAADVMFPPIRVTLGSGLDFYAGHAFMPPFTSAQGVEVDVVWLTLELILIFGAAIAGWRIGSGAAGEGTAEPRDAAMELKSP